MQQLDDGVIVGSTGSSGAPMAGEVSLAWKERREKGVVASSFWRSADAHTYPEFLILLERDNLCWIPLSAGFQNQLQICTRGFPTSLRARCRPASAVFRVLPLRGPIGCTTVGA